MISDDQAVQRDGAPCRAVRRWYASSNGKALDPISTLESRLIMLTSRYLGRHFLVRGTRRWNHFTTGPALNPVTEKDVAYFAEFLAPNSIFSTLGSTPVSSSELKPYNDDWMGKYHGKATTVVRPKTTASVSKIVKHCYEHRIGIVPQGGNTGMVGGSVPMGNELILNLGSMSNVRSFDPISGEYRT